MNTNTETVDLPQTGTAQAVLEYLNPATLLIGVNVRQDANLNDEFIDSIRELGVLQPVVAARTPDGIEVVFGKRRTLAAVAAKLESIPVLVSPLPVEALRLSAQIAENEARTELDDSERVAAFKQLALLDVPIATVVKQTGGRRKLIEAAYKVQKSKVADSIPVTLNLDMQALIADCDGVEGQAELLELANSGADNYTLRSEAQKLINAKQLADLRERYADSPIPLLDAEPSYTDTEWLPLSRILRQDKQRLSEEDFKTEQEAIDIFGDGLAIYFTRSWLPEQSAYAWVPRYAVAWEKVEELHYPTIRPRPAADKELTPAEVAERDAAHAAFLARREQTEQAFLARRTWIKDTLLARKEPAKGWERVAMAILVNDAASQAEPEIAFQLLGIEHAKLTYSYNYVEPLKAWFTNNQHRATQVLMAWNFAIAEDAALFQYEPEEEEARITITYLTFLQEHGHTLTPIEQDQLAKAREVIAAAETAADDNNDGGSE